jgi:hypothetical protein
LRQRLNTSKNDDKLQGMTLTGHDRHPPPRWVLCGLLALVLFPPWAARAFGWPVADFAMFSRVERYHLDLSVELGHYWQPVPVGSLAPHLSRDARTVILPAASNGFGKDQTDLLEGGLRDLVRLLCELNPRAARARARLGRGPLPSQSSRKLSTDLPLSWTELSVPCAAAEP